MLIVGIDGGGTKTEVWVCDPAGRVLTRTRSGGSNPAYVGEAAAVRHTVSALRGALERSGGDMPAHVACCIPGASAVQRQLLAGFGVPAERVSFLSDAESTFYGALGRREGVVVLAGTGSFVLVGQRDGKLQSFGGWGPVVGDPGSGSELAVRLLRAAAGQLDGLTPGMSLAQRVLAHYGAANGRELRRLIGARPVQELTHVLADAAADGDALALQIVEEHAEAFSEYVVKICSHCRVEPDATVALSGGMWELEELRRRFLARMSQRMPSARVRMARLPPAAGAVMIAMERVSGQVSESFIAKLEKSVSEWKGDVAAC